MKKRVTIYGERCSGTNYLEELLVLNFNVEITWDYGWKHFFGYADLSNTDDVFFIGIIRNVYDWINSFYREKHHLPKHLTENVDTFLTSPIYSLKYDDAFELMEDIPENEIMEDRNMLTQGQERYKNIFELRCVKNTFLIEKMPLLVKNYCIITYEDLTTHFIDVMNKIKDCGKLEIKTDIEFPLNVSYYKKNKNTSFIKKENTISNDTISSHL